MNAKELIEENNQKRERLTKENKKYYEDMLVYIRVSYDKSEQETEEVLAEMLDHLLEAQQDGKTAKDVFGDHPKQYADEIIGELPKAITKEWAKLISMGILYFLSVGMLFSGVFDLIAYYMFVAGDLAQEYNAGSVIIRMIISIPIAFLLVMGALHYIRWSCFKEISKVKEFLLSGLGGVFAFGVFLGVVFLTPELGPTIEVPAYMVLLGGGILFLIAHLIRKYG
ncbi:DUF1129 family protein [Lentibacillus sediminis]|uniref:DUF1129 family protein n=1 Tax=Lentibacillus sediminis TaxID=1940529 RepID=UPI000C1BD917|nr:DUF1129 family protein [Lentibacillus sediminis]